MIKMFSSDEIAQRGNGANNRRLHLNFRNVGAISTWSTKYYCLPGSTMSCYLLFDSPVQDPSAWHLHFMPLSIAVSDFVTLIPEQYIVDHTYGVLDLTWRMKWGKKSLRAPGNILHWLILQRKVYTSSFPTLAKCLGHLLLCISSCHCYLMWSKHVLLCT